jgi:hypothetical protein
MKNSNSFQALARRSIIEYAFLRWESAVLMALTVGGTALSFYLDYHGILPAWVWEACLALGLPSQALLVYSSLTDADTSRTIIARLLREKYYPHRLNDAFLQEQIDKAFAYHSRLETRVNRWRDTHLKNHLNDTARQIREWLKISYILAQRIDHYLAEYEILKSDRIHATQRLNVLQQQLSQEKDAEMQRQLQLTIHSLQRQVEALLSVDNTMKQAKLQLEHTLSAVGTIYSQTLLIEARELDGSRLERIRAEVAAEVTQLNDILGAMANVYHKPSYNEASSV